MPAARDGDPAVLRSRTTCYDVCATQRTRGTCPGAGVRVGMEILDETVIVLEQQAVSPGRLDTYVAEAERRCEAPRRRGPCPPDDSRTQLRDART
jgi:hypothetical protein